MNRQTERLSSIKSKGKLTSVQRLKNNNISLINAKKKITEIDSSNLKVKINLEETEPSTRQGSDYQEQESTP